MSRDEQYLIQAEVLDEAREDEAVHADPLRRCTHHSAHVSGKPCPVSDCIIRNEAADRIEALEAERTQLRDRMNALADVLTQHDLAHLLRPCGIHGWTPTDGWLMVETEDGDDMHHISGRENGAS